MLPPNAEPDTSIDGEVVIIGEKIDEPGPTNGVAGENVLLASILFDRSSDEVPTLSIGLAKEGLFTNFVTDTGEVLDGSDRIEFLAATVSPEHLFGDLNGNDIIDRQDLLIIRQYLREPASTFPAADIDGDGTITIRDVRKLINLCICN
nr:dockerin type I repeat-containing protein [uncultured Desulfobacter sp.]